MIHRDLLASDFVSVQKIYPSRLRQGVLAIVGLGNLARGFMAIEPPLPSVLFVLFGGIAGNCGAWLRTASWHY